MTPTETKDLLIKAARANGIEVVWVELNNCFQVVDKFGCLTKTRWNPLTNPGDCFIACAKLDIDLMWELKYVEAVHYRVAETLVVEEFFADHLTPGRTLDDAKVAAACMAAVRVMAMLADEGEG
jgi:hypothetical protein